MKIIAARWLSLAAAIIASAAMAGCGNADPLAKQVEETNSHLPEDMPYGLTLEKLSYADSTVKAYINVSESQIRINTIRIHSERLKDGFADYMRQQPDSTDVGATVSLMKDSGAALQVLFCTEADTVAITIPSAEL